MKTGLYYDPIYLEHHTGQHPESPARLKAIYEQIKALPGLALYEWRFSRPAELEEVTLVHPKNYVLRLGTLAYEGRRFMDTEDCVVSERSFDVALHAVGAALDAVLEVAENRLDNAFCAIRPPGHHALPAQCMGFCFFNNIAIAAEFLTRRLGFRKVLIFDFDVHHGNGTQAIFEERSDVFYVSMHQDPRSCFPGTGFAEEHGRSAGLGYTLNCPMPIHSTDIDYRQAFEMRIRPVLEAWKPDFVLLSAGFDAHEDDPLANINLSLAGFDYLTRQLKQIAERYAGGRLVSLLEGGYDPTTLAQCVAAHLAILREGRSYEASPKVSQVLTHWLKEGLMAPALRKFWL